MRIFDTHAHYTDSRFALDRHALLQSLPALGVDFVLCCGSDLTDSLACLRLAEEYPFVFASCGVHPHEAAGFGAPDVPALRALLAHPKCLAVGEIGLDYHYDFAPRAVQREALRLQLQLACELQLPVVLHDRDAHEDCLQALAGFALRGVMHCFSGSWEMAEVLLGMGLHLGFGGAVTFKHARRPLENAARCPAERLLLETDAPYMTPEPHRGTRCNSSHVALTAQRIADARHLPVAALLEQCNRNAAQLFGLPDGYAGCGVRALDHG